MMLWLCFLTTSAGFRIFLVFFFLARTTSSPFLPISKEVILLCFQILFQYHLSWGFPGGSVVKNPPANAGDAVRRRGLNLWVGKIPWRTEGQPTSVFLPGESHGQRSLVGYSPWGSKELHTHAHTHAHTHPISPRKPS